VDRTTFQRESELNRRAYEQLREPIRNQYAGKYVILAHGKVIDTASTLDAAQALVAQLEVVPDYYLVFPANAEPDFDLVYDLAARA